MLGSEYGLTVETDMQAGADFKYQVGYVVLGFLSWLTTTTNFVLANALSSFYCPPRNRYQNCKFQLQNQCIKETYDEL